MHTLHTHQGLHQCCHFKNTFTTCITCCGSAENATTHCRHLTSNLMLTNITVEHLTKDATMGLELSNTQFEICKQANGQFCHITTPFQPLANPRTCIAALYAKSAASIESKCFLQLCKTTTMPLPTQITPDVWILITPPSAPSDTISLICPEKPMTTHSSKMTTTHTKTAYSLQHHFFSLLFTTKI